ncbi:MAG: galactokinase [Chloroflexi bacterium]|nr:galactokinase [Chloroflexota bacterium]
MTAATDSVGPSLDALADAFATAHPAFATAPESLRFVRAPGRVNLIGEHTDYNDGLVLPAAVSLAIDLAFIPTDDRRVELSLLATGERGSFDLDAIGPRRGTWLDYVAGTAWALLEAGVPLRGFRGVLSSTIPAGAGLSSSAAIELASAWALSGGETPALQPMRLAQAAQRAENAYVGVLCGLMDQFAVTMGRAGHALRLDCRSLDWYPVALPAEVEIVVCHSSSPRRLEASAYNARRAECAAAVAAVAAREPAVTSLRDVDLTTLERSRERMGEIPYARAVHVISENARVIETEAALQAGDLEALRRLFAASHASLRDSFEVSSPELDALVGIASRTPGVVAARLTGAGFGGCTVNLVERGRSGALRDAVERDYPGLTGLIPRVFVVEAAAGTGLVRRPGAGA